MVKQKSLKLNFIMNSILTMSSFVFPIITFPYVSRTLLAEGVGRVSFATSRDSKNHNNQSKVRDYAHNNINKKDFLYCF